VSRVSARYEHLALPGICECHTAFLFLACTPYLISNECRHFSEESMLP
jgi:hypothetical protein